MSFDLENASLYARVLRAKSHGGAPEFAQAQWGPNSRVAAILQKGLLSTASVAGDPDLRAASSGFLSLVRSRSLIGKIAAVSGFAKVPFETPSLIQKTPLGAGWSGETRVIALASSSFDTASLKRKKIASIVPQTNELLKGAGADFESALTRDLVAAVAELEGAAFIDAANLETEESPAAITAGITPTTGTTDPKADIKTLLESFTGDIETAVLVTRPDAGLTLYNAGFLGSGVKGGDVAGVPHVTSNTVAAGTVALIDPSHILLADDGVVLDLSDEALLFDENNKPISLWQFNLSAIRAIRYLNWKALPGAVSVLSATWA
ncbi:phage major capsid protein [Diaphorobacter sp.]|uniref:phage major capsid protein n=1 Tax=Diaphorobacter sp. TaxID=1934310 RepID=UPI0028A9E767|nr:phage major capsid protein [Diaphorobacter sp.]